MRRRILLAILLAVTVTASALGIPRQSLQRKLRRLRTTGQLRNV